MSVAAARLAGCLALLIATAAPAEVGIAFVGALSGPAAWAGRDQRDGFGLALEERDGRLGGAAVRLYEIDDGGEAARARAIARHLVAEGVVIATGFTTAESALALQQLLRDKPVVLIASGAGPAALAGGKCSARFFSTAAPEGAVHENAGAIAQARRYRRIQLFASPAQRREVEAAFRRTYRGEIVSGGGLREVREQRPDAVYLALPPEETLAFLEAYEEVGLFHRIPVIAAGVEPALLEALGPAFSGLIVSARWAAGMESERSVRFVDAFRAKHGRTPSAYAMQAYDAALLLDRALQKSAAKPPSAAAVAKALAAGRAEGVAHPIRLGANGFAATDWHAWEVFNESSGAPYLAPRERTLRGYLGPHPSRCKAR